MSFIETALIILIFAVVVILTLRRKKPFVPPKTAPSDARTYAAYERAESLFVNRPELAFFHALQRGLPNGYYLQTKTRLEDIIGVKRTIKGEAHWKLRARVKSRHVDFLVIDGQGVPHLAIELDGSSHNAQAANADALKDGIFEAVGLPLIRVKTVEDFAAKSRQIIEILPSLNHRA